MKANIKAKIITGTYTLQANSARFNQHAYYVKTTVRTENT
jgi:hypothetical protein